MGRQNLNRVGAARRVTAFAGTKCVGRSNQYDYYHKHMENHRQRECYAFPGLQTASRDKNRYHHKQNSQGKGETERVRGYCSRDLK